MYIDSHCHLNLIMDSIISIQNILQNATSFKISKIIQVSASIEDFINFSTEIARLIDKKKELKIPELFFTFGSSPNDLCETNYSYESLLNFFNNFTIKGQNIKEFISNKKLIAIGEIGLDYFHKFFEIDKQKLAFEIQLNLAKEFDLPVMLHIRDAYDDAIDILNNFKIKNPIIFHCFSGDIKVTEKILNVFENVYFSFAGNITYKKLSFLTDSLNMIPKDRILVETDSPFLAPVPYRGKDNLPWYIIETYKYLSFKLGIDINDLSLLIAKNFNNAFKL